MHHSVGDTESERVVETGTKLEPPPPPPVSGLSLVPAAGGSAAAMTDVSTAKTVTARYL